MGVEEPTRQIADDGARLARLDGFGPGRCHGQVVGGGADAHDALGRHGVGRSEILQHAEEAVVVEDVLHLRPRDADREP